MQIIDGKKTASDIREELKSKLVNLKEKNNKIPGLVTILVGENPASKVYVNMKIKACSEIGMHSKLEKLDAEISEEELLKIIDEYNRIPTRTQSLAMVLVLGIQRSSRSTSTGETPEYEYDQETPEKTAFPSQTGTSLLQHFPEWNRVHLI
mgnify:CR=1 FL=1